MGLLNCLRRAATPAVKPEPADPLIHLINRATLVSDAELRLAARAVQKQVREQLAPHWDVGEGCVIDVIPREKPPSDEAWWLVVVDDPDVAGALGYHDVTSEGRPTGKVFARTTLDAGEAISGVVSHEVCEMLVDQRIQQWADNGRGVFYAYETSDAVQGHDYKLEGVLVANFVLPSFFHAIDETPPYDWLGVVERPFQTMPAGYQIISDDQGMRQIYGEHAASEPRRGSRRERRQRGHVSWRRSEWLPYDGSLP